MQECFIVSLVVDAAGHSHGGVEAPPVVPRVNGSLPHVRPARQFPNVSVKFYTSFNAECISFLIYVRKNITLKNNYEALLILPSYFFFITNSLITNIKNSKPEIL